MRKVEIVIFDGVDELDVVGPYEVLVNAARRGAEIDVALVVLAEPLEVRGNHGLTLQAHGVAGADVPDVFIIPGGGWNHSQWGGIREQIGRGALPARIREVHAAQSTIASVCTGAMAIAAAGLARGRRMTTHHAALEALREHGVQVVQERVVDDGEIISGGGVTSGIDLGLYLVRRLTGDDRLADELAKQLEYKRHADSARKGGTPTGSS